MRPEILFTMFCLLLSSMTLAGIRKESSIDQFEHAFADVQAQIKSHGAEQVMLVLDLDNTVLHSRQLLGSYGWFKWQEKMLSDPKAPQDGRVAETLDELFHINGLLFSYGSMELSEAHLAKRLAELQKKGVRILCLTSRSPAYWESTIRDLQRNGLDFSDAFWSIPELAYAKDFFPEDVLKARFQLRSEDITRFGLSRPAQIMLREGVMFTTGLHKGSIMDLLLKMKGVQPKALVFVDDSAGNIASLRDVYAQHELEVSLFRYTRYDDEVGQFASQSRPEAMKLWKQWKSILASRDPRKLDRFIRLHYQ